MVGLRFLAPSIGVRIPVSQQSAGRKCETFAAFAVAREYRDSKKASGEAGTQGFGFRTEATGSRNTLFWRRLSNKIVM